VADQIGALQTCELYAESGETYGVTVTRVAGAEDLRIEMDTPR
jgi:hypothetical protein